MSQHQHTNQHYQQRNHHQPRNPQGQRREFLWRERVKLEMQVHVLIARTTSLAQKW